MVCHCWLAQQCKLCIRYSLLDKPAVAPNMTHCTSKLLYTALSAAAFFVAAIVQAQDKVTYDDHLAPIFRQRCSSCHNPTAKKADLDVTNYLDLDAGRRIRSRHRSR